MIMKDRIESDIAESAGPRLPDFGIACHEVLVAGGEVLLAVRARQDAVFEVLRQPIDARELFVLKVKENMTTKDNIERVLDIANEAARQARYYVPALEEKDAELARKVLLLHEAAIAVCDHIAAKKRG
jgi:hypothetical protein